jgi:hypothetical protein
VHARGRGADRELGAVHAARHARAGARPHERSEQRIAAEHRCDSAGVGVQIEQVARPLHGGVEVALVVQPEARLHAALRRPQLDYPVSVP